MSAKHERLKKMLADMAVSAQAGGADADSDVPSRVELIQYERRFSELYQQVGWRLGETRKYFDQYNAMDAALGYTEKEVGVGVWGGGKWGSPLGVCDGM